MKKIITLLILTFAFTVCAFSQEKKNCNSKVSSRLSQCANIVFIAKSLKVKEIKGIITSPLDSPAIIEIYKISEEQSKEDPYNLTRYETPFKVYETNEDGEFCIKNFPEGYYVLKFGTSDGGWNCTWMIVQVSKNTKDRKIELGLEIGI